MSGENRISQIINSPQPSPQPGPPASPPGGGPSSAPPAGTPAPTPGPPASPPPPGGGGTGQVENVPQAIDDLARRLSADVGPKLTKAAQDIGALHLAESAYTALTYSLAVAYTEASAFVIKDLHSKAERLDDIDHRLKATAANWREAGDKSTVHGV